MRRGSRGGFTSRSEALQGQERHISSSSSSNLSSPANVQPKNSAWSIMSGVGYKSAVVFAWRSHLARQVAGPSAGHVPRVNLDEVRPQDNASIPKYRSTVTEVRGAVDVKVRDPVMKVQRIVWREHAKAPGVATFEYVDGGHDHREVSQYESRSLAGSLGLVEVRDSPEFKEWVRR